MLAKKKLTLVSARWKPYLKDFKRERKKLGREVMAPYASKEKQFQKQVVVWLE